MAAASSTSVLTARPVVAALRARGLDPAWVLHRAQLSEEVLASVDSRLPCCRVGMLWELAAEAVSDPSFGIHVAEALPAGAYDVYEHVLAAADTVGAGIARIARYAPLIDGDTTMRLTIEPAHARLVRRSSAIAPQYDEFSLTLLLLRSRRASAARWTAERVTLQHVRAEDDGELSRVFGCPLVYGAAETELLIPRAVLDLPHVRADAALSEVLGRHLDAALGALRPRGALVERVSAAIARRFAAELPSLSATAADVRVPERTLQRRLADDGLSHSAIVDDVRRSLVFQYLREPRLSVTDVAFLLHFGDSTAFYRAFKRWTTESPASYRQRFLAETRGA